MMRMAPSIVRYDHLLGVTCAGSLHAHTYCLTLDGNSSAPAGAGRGCDMCSTGCATLRAASLHPWLQAVAPLGRGGGWVAWTGWVIVPRGAWGYA